MTCISRHAAWRLAFALAVSVAAGPARPAAAADTGAEPTYLELRARVLASDPARLARLGRHVIAGIDDVGEIQRLIEAGAISGVFLTGKNLRGRSMVAVRQQIASLQALRRASGLPPLWIAADQEGGLVQRLSPPLPQMPPLSRLVATHDIPVERKAAVLDYGLKQGRGLAALGVTVNFAPVVDIDHGLRNPRDAHTRVGRRALARTPAAVAEAASWYCDGLRAAGVVCTRKHFPGLGHVHADTHVSEATLDTPIRALAVADWVPFAGTTDGPGETGDRQGDWTMIGHVRLKGLDPATPASVSKAVVSALREERKIGGIVVTDDFSMGAIRKSALGTGGSAVAALNAGVDLVLVNYHPRDLYVVLDALLTADAAGQLDADMLRKSTVRLGKASEAAIARSGTGSGTTPAAVATPTVAPAGTPAPKPAPPLASR